MSEPATRWVLPLPWDKPPLSLNQGGHWAKSSGMKAELRRAGALLARHAGVPRGLPHIHSRLHWCPPDNRRRDEDNIILTAKPLWDGLVDVGIIQDDTSEFITKLMPKIHPAEKNRTQPRVWLEIWTEDEE